MQSGVSRQRRGLAAQPWQQATTTRLLGHSASVGVVVKTVEIAPLIARRRFSKDSELHWALRDHSSPTGYADGTTFAPVDRSVGRLDWSVIDPMKVRVSKGASHFLTGSEYFAIDAEVTLNQVRRLPCERQSQPSPCCRTSVAPGIVDLEMKREPLSVRA